MKAGVRRPVMKQTPSDQPVLLMKVAQTNWLEAFGDARTKIPMKIVANIPILRRTKKSSINKVSFRRTLEEQCERRELVRTSNCMCNWDPSQGEEIID